MARGLVGLTAGVVAGVLFGSSAAAAVSSTHPVYLEVDLARGSDACPGPQQILVASRALFPDAGLQSPQPEDDGVLAVAVSIRPVADGHEAVLKVSGPRNGERTLVDRDVGCRGLADAIAVAIVLMVDPTATRTRRTVPPPPQIRSKAPEKGEAVRLGAEGGALGSVGVLGTRAYGGFLGVALTAWKGATLRLRGTRQFGTTTTVELPATEVTTGGSGEVSVDLWAGGLATCWRLERGTALALTPCLDFMAGSQRGESRSFPQGNGTFRRPFVALGPSLSLSILARAGVEVVLTGGLSANLWRQSYLVDATPAQAQKLLGAYGGLGLGTTWSWGRPAGR